MGLCRRHVGSTYVALLPPMFLLLAFSASCGKTAVEEATQTKKPEATPRLHNADFEAASLNGWSVYGGIPASVVNATPHAGNSCLRETGAAAGGVYQDVPGLLPGKIYEASVWTRSEPGTTAKAQLWVHDTTEANVAGSEILLPGGEWKQLKARFTATATGKIRVHLHYTGGAGAIYYDTVEVAEGP